MANFMEPSVHNAETVRAEVADQSDCTCIRLTFDGRNMYGEARRITLPVFFDKPGNPYAAALTAAINAVPVPSTEEA